MLAKDYTELALALRKARVQAQGMPKDVRDQLLVGVFNRAGSIADRIEEIDTLFNRKLFFTIIRGRKREIST